MSGIEQRVRTAEVALAAKNEVLVAALTERVDLSDQIAALERQDPGPSGDRRTWLRRLARMRTLLSRHDVTVSATEAEVAVQRVELEALRRDAELQATFAEWPAGDLPLALLPVRVETRFVTTDSAQLWVRVFPDDLHLDAHEAELTADEEQAGHGFWTALWRAGSSDGGGPVERRADARRLLIDRYGRERSDWIVRATAPTNAADRPGDAVDDDATLAVSPVFPAVKIADDSWTQAAVVRALPDRWIVVGHRGGERVLVASSAEVQRPLAGGLDPLADDPSDGSGVDAGARWIVDFGEAERVGMAMRIDLSDEDLRLGFDTLLVFGVRSAAGHAAEPGEFDELLLSHRFTGGLSLLPRGVATNNTADVDAGARPAGSDASLSAFAAEDPGAEPPARSDGAALMSALGTGPAVVAHLPFADAVDLEAARAMNTAVWEATGGYFLEQFLLDPAADGGGAAAARRHFADHVRGMGPLPAVRVGAQPYGVLPATSLVDVAAAAAAGDWVGVASALVPKWRAAAAKLPRASGLINAQENAEQVLLEVLASGPLASAYHARPVFDHDVLNATPIITESDDAVLTRRRSLVEALLAQLGVAGQPRIVETVLATDAFELTGRAVHARSAAESEAGEDGNAVLSLSPAAFIGWLLDSPAEVVRAESDLPGGADPPSSLLYLVLRHSLLLAYNRVAFEIQLATGVAAADDRVDPSWVDIVSADTATAGRHVDRGLPGLAGKAVHELTAADHPAAAVLDDIRAALALLRSMPVAALDELLLSTLDVFSHRLDAWVTSVATRRLAELRSTEKGAAVVGGFGWLENVGRGPKRQTVAPLPPGEDGELTRQAGNAGYVHAPSLGQATTAAVMRSGYLATTGADASRPLAIDLSSARVRRGAQILEGIRNGQSLGELLGYRFERRLHDDRLDRYITIFRRATPLGRTRTLDVQIRLLEGGIIGPLVPGNRQRIAALRAERDEIVDLLRADHLFPPAMGRDEMAELMTLKVVDGHRLVEMWRSDRAISTWDSELPRPGQPDHDELVAALDDLDDVVDAVGDLLTAESIHQLVSGAPQRTGESLDAVLRGEQPPAEFDVVRTPRSGAATTHRIVVVLEADRAAPRWPRSTADVMGLAEPRLDRWAGLLLGDPTTCRCRARFVDAVSETVIEEQVVSLADLGLGALEVLHLASAGEGAFIATIEARLHEQLMIKDRPAAVPADAVLHLDFGRADGDAVDAPTVAEFATLATSLADSLLDARPLEPRDLSPTDGDAGAVDTGELRARVEAVVAALDDAIAEAAARLADERAQAGSVTIDEWFHVLDRLAKFAIIEAYPEPGGRTVDGLAEQLFAQVAVAHDRAVARQSAAAIVSEAAAGAGDVANLVAEMRAVLGQGFAVLATFEPRERAELQATFAASDALQGGDPFASLTWFQRIAAVRAGPERLNRALQFCEVLTRRRVFGLMVGQLPHVAADRWVALPPTDERPLRAAALSVVAQIPEPVTFVAPVGGLLIDEWTEVVPAAAETTGVAVHFDQPGTEAPNAIVVAVTPDNTDRWDFVQVERILLETFELARTRAVDPRTLFEQTDLDLVLPALYLGLNLAGDTVSTDFTRAKQGSG